MHYLREHRPAATVSFSAASADGASGGEGDAMDGLPDRAGSDPHTSAERCDLQRWVTLGLSTRDRLIVILYYYEEMTMREIGSALGISESRVSQRLESILAALRARIERTEGAEQLLARG
jgi:RNA polymerase sigma factor for flagellar operon FliA